MYFCSPFIAWFLSGTLKFLINYFKYGKDAKNRIGNGGFPSTHTTIMTTITGLIGLKEGFSTPIFGLAIAITFIVIIDALGLRRALGEHAKIVNKLKTEVGFVTTDLREQQGHSKFEVLGGLVLGTTIAGIISLF
ncbi:divergent PAP2 family protein [Paenibacillus cremeus]|nr:divergent PAP2 family protein [Paenibacillus cremeus]